MHHPSPPHYNQKKITDPTTRSIGSGSRKHPVPSNIKDKVIRERSTLKPEGEQEANPDPRMDSETRHGTAGRNRLGGRSHDSSMESSNNDRNDMPDREKVAEEEQEDASEDEQGDPYRSRRRDDDMLENERKRLKRHRSEVAGRVWIPEIWGQEELLKDWVDCTVFDSSLVRSKIMAAKAALVEEGRRASSPALPIENRC